MYMLWTQSICTGMEQIATSKSEEKAKVQSVLLLTDGLANEGITGTANIINQIKKFQVEGMGAVSMGASGGQMFMPQQRRQVRRPPQAQPQGQARQGFFGWLFGNRAPAAPQQPVQQQAPPQLQQQQQQAPPQLQQQQAPPQLQQQQAPPQLQQQQAPPQLQQQQQAPPQLQQQQAPPQLQQQQQAPPLVPQANVANVAPPLQLNVDSDDSEEDMEVEVPEEDPKPKPSGPKVRQSKYYVV